MSEEIKDIHNNQNNIVGEPAVTASITAQALATEQSLPLNSEKSRMKVSIDKLSYLSDGWNGVDAKSISQIVIENMLSVVLRSSNEDWLGWTIEPNTNGTLILRLRSKKAAISLGAERYSYFIKEGRNVTGRNNIDFTPSALLSTIRILNS